MTKSNDDNDILIRPATRDDLPEISEIFNYYVANSTCVWRTDPCGEEERRTWFEARDERMPALVAEIGGRIVGWGALSEFRKAYTLAGTLEDSIYVHHDFHRQGIGGRLLAELIQIARKKGVRSLLANISADQEPSIRMHQKFGFQKAAHLRQVGLKFGRRLDAVYLQLMLCDEGGADASGVARPGSN
jgi:phosphinothricin acetyltransferase